MQQFYYLAVLFVAGGVGTAPVYPQVKWLREHGVKADVIIGAAAAQRIRAHTLRPLGSLQLRGAEVMMEVFTVEPR